MKPITFMSRRCRDCGAPLYTRFFRRWNEDGTVTARFTEDIRLCQVETGTIAAIIDGLSEKIGYPVDLIAIQGQRKAMRKMGEEFFTMGHGALGYLSRTRLVSNLILKISMGVGLTVGHALPEELEYEPGRLFKVRVRKPYCWQLIVGDVWGGFEALHNVTAEVRYAVEGESLLIRVEKVGEGMVWDDPSRLQLRRMGRINHSAGYERCARCGVPLEVSRRTEWDAENGMVFNRTTGRREATIMVEPLAAMLRELESELGDEIPKMVQEIVTDYTARGIPARAAAAMRSDGYRCTLDKLRTSGMGYPASVEMRRGALTVRIDNPFSGVLLAGIVAGMYAAVEGTKAHAWWACDPKGYLIVEVTPA
ncbi:MAG: hypothetical protein ACYC99_11055 [Candidatus Geothermincolia bacterium]